MNGGVGFGPRAEVQITKQTDETRRQISIRTAHSMAKTSNLQTLAVYLVIFLYWWFVLMCLYEPLPKLTPFMQWWGRVVYVFGTWGRTMGRSWPLWLLPFPIQWIKPLYILNRHNLKPKVMNDEWPMTHAPLDPNVVGMVGYEALNEIVARGTAVVPPVAQPTTLITLDLTDGSTHRYLTDIDLVPELRQFAQGVLAGVVSFSERGATGCHWDKAAYKDLRDQMIERKMISWKNGHNKRSGYNIAPIARRALDELALPHSPD